jgi:flagellin
MPISLLTNVPSLNVKRHMDESSDKYATAAERLASGKRINKAGDDAAGLSISFGIESRIRSLQQARRNAFDALSMMQVAEGGMNEVGNLVIRLRELAIQSASDNVSDKEREMLELEASQIKMEVDRLSESTRFFDTPLLNGTGKNFTFQIGADNNEHNRIEYNTAALDLRTDTLGLGNVELKSSGEALDSLEYIDEALKKMNVPRAQVGAIQSRFNAITQHLAVYEETLTSANSRIRDADIAKETADIVKAQVLQRAGIAVLAQANMQPTAVLRLIDG